jgi:hypothetical protein
MGPIGAILAIPASLLAKALLVDMDPDAKWLELFLGDEPVFKKKKVGAVLPQATAAAAPAGESPPKPADAGESPPKPADAGESPPKPADAGESPPNSGPSTPPVG